MTEQTRLPLSRVIELPEPALVVLVGASGSGKSTFAARHFRATEVVSSDACRGLVSDDENDQSATNDAFELLQFIVAKRLRAGRLTVVDATNVKPDHREPLVVLALRHHAAPVAIVFDLAEHICLERNRTRPDRDFPPHVVRAHVRALRRSLGGMHREGFRCVHAFRSTDDIDTTVVRAPRAGEPD